jgi:hypothetical protein
MIKAIDAQQIILQSEQASRVQQVDRQHHDEMQKRYLDIQSQEEKKLLQKAVKNPDETEKTMIREDDQRRNNQQQGQAKDETEKKDESMDDETPQEGEHINIRV